MHSLLRLFWNLCLLRTSPAAMPRAPVLLLLVILAGFVVDNLNLAISVGAPAWSRVPVVILVHSGLYYGSVAALLALFGYRSRILQTLTALAGSGVLLSLLALPLLMLMALLPGSTALLVWPLLGLQIWSLLVMAHILRHALSIGLLPGAILAFGYFLMSIKLVQQLLPPVVSQVH